MKKIRKYISDKRSNPEKWFINSTILVMLIFFLGCTSNNQWDFGTKYFKIHINDKGFITSMKNITVKPEREFSPEDKSSPLMCLYDSKKKVYYEPNNAIFNKADSTITLTFENNSVARVSLVSKRKYFKLTLESLSPRNGIDDIQWGPYYTNITNLFGEVIGVARDTSEANNYAIGVLALNDITTGGTSDTEGDVAPFQYVIHSPDPQNITLPDSLHEGQLFPIGGDGISDVAFFSHPEPYFRILYGKSASIDQQGQVYITYHASDRTKERNIEFSLIPFLAAHKPNHQEVQALPGVDFIGSSIALWGSPDSTALLDLVQKIVLDEGLPHPTINGKWIKDPARYIPDVSTSGGLYDSVISYTSRIGFKAIEVNDLPMFKVDRGNVGYIDGKSFEKKPLKFSAGNKSHKEFTDISNPLGVFMGRHTICTSLAPGTKDASPVPSDSLCYQQKKILAHDISAADTIIEVNDPKYLDEIAGWEGHFRNLNMIKIGKELVHYLGVSEKPPYVLKHVTRGYWETQASNHQKGDTIYKLQVTVDYGYRGLIPNIFLQDKIAEYYADVAQINGMYFMDLDGQEFLFDQGQGYYSVKRFFGKMFERAKEVGISYLRITGATLSEGSWHYQSVWNVGGGKNMYDVQARKWGTTTSEGKDLRDVAYANYFPATFGVNFGLKPNSTVADYEHVEAISIGVGATYMLQINQKDVESCPQKDAIFKAIRTWENARAANAFPRWIKKKLANPKNSWTLETGEDKDTWKLYQIVEGKKSKPVVLRRAKGY